MNVELRPFVRSVRRDPGAFAEPGWLLCV